MPSPNQTLDADPRFVEAADGRRIAYSELGSSTGRPLVYCHGFPSSRREARLLHQGALTAEVRLIAPDRPGYGDSDHQADRQIIDWSDDVALLADRLELERVGIIGVSGGGPYALACAARIPKRLLGCALVCPLGPIYIDELLSQMNWSVRTNLMIGKQPEWLNNLLFGTPTTALLARWPQLVEDMRRIAAPAADRLALGCGNNSTILNQTIADAMRNGAPGARRDLFLYTHDWQVPFADITLPVSIWHGDADAIAPIQHARWYADHLPNAGLTELPGEGHYSVPLLFGTQIITTLFDL